MRQGGRNLRRWLHRDADNLYIIAQCPCANQVAISLPIAKATVLADAEITELLHEWRAGKPAAMDRLFEAVYPRLRDIAGALFRNERLEHVLQPTSVVNELFLKLLRQRSLRFEDREHFYSLSARIMRRLLIDQAREHRRQKRDGGERVPLDENLAWIDASEACLLDLDDALLKLEQVDPVKCRIVELRFFLGFTATETAELLSMSKASVDRQLKFVKGWLYDQLRDSAR
jgi:RNA polymerase sigma factor (TIGR02999 family)